MNGVRENLPWVPEVCLARFLSKYFCLLCTRKNHWYPGWRKSRESETNCTKQSLNKNHNNDLPNISNMRDSVSLGYPNTEKRVKN